MEITAENKSQITTGHRIESRYSYSVEVLGVGDSEILEVKIVSANGEQSTRITRRCLIGATITNP